jgi:hypothetical protein
MFMSGARKARTLTRGGAMLKKHKKLFIALLIAVVVSLAGVTAYSYLERNPPVPTPSNGLLLPYFEVGLDTQETYKLSVGNNYSNSMNVFLEVFSNWGWPIAKVMISIPGKGMRTIDLHKWLVDGILPDGKTLTISQLSEIQTKLLGNVFLGDGRYYASSVGLNKLTGYVTVHWDIFISSDSLWGDYAYVDENGHKLGGDRLVRFYTSYGCPDLCRWRQIRFSEDKQIGNLTDIFFWAWDFQYDKGPSASQDTSNRVVPVEINVFDVDGNLVYTNLVDLLPTQKVDVSFLDDLNVKNGSITFRLQQDNNALASHVIYVEAHYTLSYGGSLVSSWCLEEPLPLPPPSRPTATPTPFIPPPPPPTATSTPFIPPPPPPTATPTHKSTCPPKPTATPTHKETCPPKPTATPTHKGTSCPPKPTATPTHEWHHYR